MLLSLHARRTATAVAASRDCAPDRPVAVVLTGTDLYADLPDDEAARASVEAADGLIVLQDLAVARLESMDHTWAGKAHVVHQSVEPPLPERSVPSGRFVVAVLAHMRQVKDPLLAARASRLAPPTSQIEVVHAGAAFDDNWRARAEAEQAENARYRWLGPLDRASSLELIASASVLACTSELEGGANVVSEAIALGVPVVGTRIDGNVGLLGSDYPGLVQVGDARALADWLLALERQPDLLADLTARTFDRAHLTSVDRERQALADVLAVLA